MRRDPLWSGLSVQSWALEVHRAEQIRRAEHARIAAAVCPQTPGLLKRLRARMIERRLPKVQSVSTSEVRIRAPRADDRLGLLYLALRAGSSVVPGPLLVAELDGRLHAAASLSSDAVLADDSPHASELLNLLQLRAEQLRARAHHGR